MLKMYHEQEDAGNTPDFWEENWEGSTFTESLRFCSVDPLRAIFEKYSKPGNLMLEGGCGLGQYLVFYKARGLNVIGLDFAQRALKNLKIRQPNLDLCGGDVSTLPFPDRSFDLYYSGGVVEHFETGPDKSLSEARRVIKDEGVLLISVPYQSPLRTILFHFKKRCWRLVETEQSDDSASMAGQRFFQYAYRRNEFRERLANAGLRVIEERGYAVLWGLTEIPFVNRSKKNKSLEPGVPKGMNRPAEGDIHDFESLTNEPTISYLKRVLVVEDETAPGARWIVKFMRWMSGNMMMYVCVRD